ncbi:MAG: hypothetical protein Tsb0027_22830 [Wenzhouxiangellaceae bacterium]
MFGIDWATTGGIMTVLALVLFIGVAIWAWSPARKKRFDEAAQIPLQDEAQTQRSANDSRSDENTDQEQKS